MKGYIVKSYLELLIIYRIVTKDILKKVKNLKNHLILLLLLR